MAKKTIFWPGWLINSPLTPDPNDFTFSVKSQKREIFHFVQKDRRAEQDFFPANNACRGALLMLAGVAC